MELDKKYRPKTLKEVIGQQSTVSSINMLFSTPPIPHAYIFTGPSGIGKTTIARILATMVDAADIIEVDGASYTGIDDMREIAENLRYKSFMGNGIKFLILDESHMLSKNAWNSWLKIVEEPPEHVYFAFCTTEQNKVPKTIRTRCHTYQLSPLSDDDIEELIAKVCHYEKIAVKNEIVNLIIKESEGSARQALVYLSQMYNLSFEEAKKLTLSAVGDINAIKLCRLLINGADQNAILSVLKDLKGINPYSLKIEIVNYFTGCVLNSRTPEELRKFLFMLEVFNNTPIDQNMGFASIVLAANEISMKK